MPTQEQLFISVLFTSIVVALMVIPFFARIITTYNDYTEGKEDRVMRGLFWAVMIHLFIVIFVIAAIKMWDLLIGSSLPEFILQGSGGLFDIFWSDCGNLAGDSELTNSLNAYRCIFFSFFEFTVSMMIGMSPVLFFILALFLTSPNKRQEGGASGIFSRFMNAILYTLAGLIILFLYLDSMNEVIFYKGGAETVYDMSKTFWQKMLTV